MREVRIAIGLAGLSLLATNAARGQAPAKLEFEVASVRPWTPSSQPIGPTGGPGTSDPGQITWPGATLNWLLATAYDVRPYQISGPAWLNSERHTIVAKVPEGATKEQVKLMWQSLLKDRFGAVVHHESRVFQGEEMTLPKGPSRLKRTGIGRDALLDKYLPTPNWSVADGADRQTRRLLARAQTPQQVASILEQLSGHPVIDKTGLSGQYDFNVELDLGEPPCISCALASALEQDYGLKLVKSAVTLDVIVVDHADKTPVEN